MRFSFPASKYPEYRALRAQNRSLSLVWQAGHAAILLSPLFVFAAVLLLAVVQIDPDVSRERSPWPVVAALLLWAGVCVGLGIYLRRYAIRKGAISHGANE
jgi:hypothetical protein